MHASVVPPPLEALISDEPFVERKHLGDQRHGMKVGRAVVDAKSCGLIIEVTVPHRSIRGRALSIHLGYRRDGRSCMRRNSFASLVVVVQRLGPHPLRRIVRSRFETRVDLDPATIRAVVERLEVVDVDLALQRAAIDQGPPWMGSQEAPPPGGKDGVDAVARCAQSRVEISLERTDIVHIASWTGALHLGTEIGPKCGEVDGDGQRGFAKRRCDEDRER